LKILRVLLEKEKKIKLKGKCEGKNLIQLVLAFDSSFLKGEVGGSRQQQGVTSQASPVGRYPTS
jgi:hypothetical protein